MLVAYATPAPPPRVATELERGRIVKFLPSPVPLPEARDSAFLAPYHILQHGMPAAQAAA